jgi:hypothetical protein
VREDVEAYVAALGVPGRRELAVAAEVLDQIAADSDLEQWLAGAVERGHDVCSELAEAVVGYG